MGLWQPPTIIQIIAWQCNNKVRQPQIIIQIKHCFAMRIHGNVYFKHELSLIVMNLWSLHGNSC